jgi:hypothetical protein
MKNYCSIARISSLVWRQSKTWGPVYNVTPMRRLRKVIKHRLRGANVSARAGHISHEMSEVLYCLHHTSQPFGQPQLGSFGIHSSDSNQYELAFLCVTLEYMLQKSVCLPLSPQTWALFFWLNLYFIRSWSFRLNVCEKNWKWGKYLMSEEENVTLFDVGTNLLPRNQPSFCSCNVVSLFLTSLLKTQYKAEV